MTREDELVASVLASFDDTPDPRLREVMAALVRHLQQAVHAMPARP